MKDGVAHLSGAAGLMRGMLQVKWVGPGVFSVLQTGLGSSLENGWVCQAVSGALRGRTVWATLRDWQTGELLVFVCLAVGNPEGPLWGVDDQKH